MKKLLKTIEIYLDDKYNIIFRKRTPLRTISGFSSTSIYPNYPYFPYHIIVYRTKNSIELEIIRGSNYIKKLKSFPIIIEPSIYEEIMKKDEKEVIKTLFNFFSINALTMDEVIERLKHEKFNQ